jgi:fused signal recognition particle receptor
MKFLESLSKQFVGKPINWDELEETLIRADLGVPMTIRIIKTLQEREAWALLGIGDVIKAVREEIARILPRDPVPIRRATGKPTVILIVGVNGTGKTTSTAKLARCLQGRGGSPERPLGDWGPVTDAKQRPGFPSPLPRASVMLAAADTFRAAAIEQLDIWAKRLGVEIVRGQHGADPAAICFEAYQAAAKQESNFLLCVTAGRQHTIAYLMAELQKIKRTLCKLDEDSPQETLLVVDATTGGNALSQAREFHTALGLTGLIVTKLDGSGKGGIVVAIQNELGIPTRFIGTGEKLDDFAPFERKTYLENLL